MSDSLRRDAEELFQRVADLAPDERDALIERECHDRPELAAEVRALVRLFEHDSGTFLAQPAMRFESTDLEHALPRQIGPYHIVRVIGEGGMGIVCEARQENPHRVVALKLVQPGMASASALRRFRRESDVLAQLQHPGVAHVYDAGAARVQLPDGLVIEQSYFAMELIDGQPLTQYADAHRLSVEQRLDLLARVADAVQYAHQRGIVHRDLKPGNIYVDQSGQPKVLDFGVARILDSDQTLAATQTAAGQIIGTLPYMSPEQVIGDTRQIDTRCDVYSLGVVLYELLTGKLPLDVRDRPFAEAARIIRDEEPRRVTAVIPQLRGDVATIVAKALEKEPARRYGSAGELAADIRRFLRDEPIQARPATATYLLRKFARRHRALVISAAIAVLALIGGAVLAGWWAVVAERARGTAELKSAEALRQQERAERLAYSGNLSAAAAALEAHDAVLARTHLEAAPRAMRGWEWDHFWSRLDQSLLTIAHAPEATPNWAKFMPDDASVRISIPQGDQWREARWDATTGAQLDSLSPPDRTTVPHRDSYRIWLEQQPDGGYTIHDNQSGGQMAAHLADWDIPIDGKFYVVQGCRSRARFGIVYTVAKQWPDATVTIIDLDVGRHWQHNVKFFENPDLALGEQGVVALAAGEDGKPALWDLETDTMTPMIGHTDFVRTIALSPDERTVLTGSRDATVRMWDAQSGAALAVGRGHRDAVIFAEFSPDGTRIASCSADRTVRIWEPTTLELRSTYHGHVVEPLSLEYSHDSRRVVTSSRDGTTRIWDGRGDRDPSVLRRHTSYIYALALAPSGECFATGGWDGEVILWNAETQREIARMRPDAGNIHVIAFSSDGRYLAATTDQERLIVWRRSDLVEVARASYTNFWNLSIVNANEVLLTCDLERNAATFWNFETDQTRELPLAELGRLAGSHVSASGRFLEYYFPHARMHILDLTNGGRDLWQQSIAWTVASAFSPPTVQPEQMIAPIGDDPRSVGVWEVATGRQLGVLRGHTDEVYAVAWSPDGTRIATGGRDQLIRIWDAQSLDEITRLQGHRSYIKGIVFSRDGRTLYSASGDYTVRIWGMSPFRDLVRGDDLP